MEWLSFFRVNVLSGIRLSRTYLPGMMRRGWGRGVFVSSEAALNIPPDSPRYATTMTANLSIARGLAKRVGGTRVTVNSVPPGPTLPDGVADMLLSMGAATHNDLVAVADGPDAAAP